MVDRRLRCDEGDTGPNLEEHQAAGNMGATYVSALEDFSERVALFHMPFCGDVLGNDFDLLHNLSFAVFLATKATDSPCGFLLTIYRKEPSYGLKIRPVLLLNQTGMGATYLVSPVTERQMH